VALTDHDLSELLAALQAGEMTDTIRTSLEWVLQQLIEVEATAVIAARPGLLAFVAFPSPTGARSGPPIGSDGSTATSSSAPTSWGASRTIRP
jgi:hypothetical protein